MGINGADGSASLRKVAYRQTNSLSLLRWRLLLFRNVEKNQTQSYPGLSFLLRARAATSAHV